jgi:hypothetical protein
MNPFTLMTVLSAAGYPEILFSVNTAAFPYKLPAKFVLLTRPGETLLTEFPGVYFSSASFKIGRDGALVAKGGSVTMDVRDLRDLSEVSRVVGPIVVTAGYFDSIGGQAHHLTDGAYDIRTKDRTPAQRAALFAALQAMGWKTHYEPEPIDEKGRPYRIWTGPHVHTNAPRPRQAQSP